MENYLFFRKIRPKVFKYTVTATDVSNWANAPQGSATTYIDPTALLGAANLKLNETAKIEIKSAGSNSNIGSSYGSSVSAGDVTTLTQSTLFALPSSNRITFKEASGSGSPDTTYGYTCIDGDELTIYFGDGQENWVAYPASRLIGVSLGSSDTISNVHFKSLKGDANDDVVVFRHASGKYPLFCKMINDACNYKAGKEGSFVTVFDGAGGEIKYLGNSSEYADLGVDRVDIVIESGY